MSKASHAKITQFQVQTVSISYLRCLIEHVRCFILDRDIELVYYTIRKSSDVLTRDPMQLGAQVICFSAQSSEWEVSRKFDRQREGEGAEAAGKKFLMRYRSWK